MPESVWRSMAPPPQKKKSVDFVIAETAAKRLIAFEYRNGERTTWRITCHRLPRAAQACR